LELQRAGGINDGVTIERCRRDFDWHRTSSNDDAVGTQYLLAAIGSSHFHLAIFQQLAGAADTGNAVGFEQPGDTTSQLLHHFGLAGNHGRYVDLDLAYLDAVHVKAVAGLMEFVRGIE